MSKYIDADRLKQAVEHELDMQDLYLPVHFFEVVDGMEAADVAEIKRGRWLTTDAYPHKVYCSNCYGTYALDHWGIWIDESLPRNYCPNCGAKMDEVTERKCDTCVIAQTHNLEDDDSPCLDCEEE